MRKKLLYILPLFTLMLMFVAGCSKKASKTTVPKITTVTQKITTTKTQKTVSSIEISTEATNKAFHMGDTFDASGLKIKIVYSDNSKSDEIEASELTIVNPDLTTKGTKDVTVKYTVDSIEYSTSYQVTVDHSLAHKNSISETCTVDGNIEYWYCSECDKYYAFNGFENLTSITIPSSVTSIGEEAFNGCSVEIIWYGTPTIKTIGEGAFAFYNGTSITIPSSVTSIDFYAFDSCTNLATVYIDSATVAAGITSNSSHVFGHLVDSATTIYIESGINTVGEYITTNYTRAELTETFNSKTYYKYTKKA